MFQFTGEEQLRLRQRVQENPSIIEELKALTKEVYTTEVIVPKTGIANWKLYYYCSKHSVQLTFDRTKPYQHQCPIDGEIFTGEPYDSTWWGFINQMNYLGVYHMGLLYMLTQDRSYGEKVKAILLAYATYYPEYEVHGDIPYNHPGKASAQALDEAIFLRHLACGYDLIEDLLSEEEHTYIQERLLLEGAQFLVKQRTNQLHNHEVIINAAVGVIGILLEREELIQFALYTPYGLVYQLERGVLADKHWFEGSMSYHFYALQSFFGYEKFALHTKYSLIQHPNYLEMMYSVIHLLQPDFTFPLLNDMHVGQDKLRGYLQYEFIYRCSRDERLLQILHKIYENRPRNNMEAFFYGVEELPEVESLKLKSYHNEEGSGLTVMRGKEDRYLVFKHSPYGGEHDHYDRLGISYTSHGKRIMPDLGTTGYGATLHYDYYKNTGTHNTVVIDEMNQMPAQCVVYDYQETPDYTYIDAGVDFTSEYEMPDSFTIKQWDEKAYEGALMRRRILWTEDYFIELFTVNHKDVHTIDWVCHVPGTRQEGVDEGRRIDSLSNQKPYCYLSHVIEKKSSDNTLTTWQIDEVTYRMHSYTKNITTYYGVGPDNPSVSDISYMIHRCVGKDALFINVCESYKEEAQVKNVQYEIGFEEIIVHLDLKDGMKSHRIPLKSQGR